MLFLPSAPTVSLTVPTSVGLPSLRVIQCSSRKLGTFISQSFESHGLMSQVEAEAEAEWPASVALLEAFSGLGFSSMRAACARRVKAAAEAGREGTQRTLCRDLTTSAVALLSLSVWPGACEVMSASAEAGAAAPSRAAELEAQVAELTQKLERETYRSAQLAAQVKEKTRKHGELVRPSLLCLGCPLLSTMPA